MSTEVTTGLDPQAAAHLAAAADAPGVAELTVPEARAAGLGYLGLQRPMPTDVDVEHRFVPGPTADLPIRVIRPHGASRGGPVVVVLHGSGWVIANLDVVEEPARVLAVDSGVTVVTVNYQKAPEHPFPVPLDDSVAAIRWVQDHAAELDVDAGRLALVGDSAGGNLVAAASAELAAAGRPVAAQALLYPALDHRAGSESYRTFARGTGLDDVDMAWFWRHYLGDRDPGTDPRVSPILAEDVSGLPPTFVATAGHDVLRDEGEAYAARLAEAGVPVEARRYEGMIHGFWWMDAVLDVARTLQLDLATFLRARLAG